MSKNNQGVSLLSLVITIAVLAIITSITLKSGVSNIKQVKMGRILTHMILVNAKVQTIYEEYQFSGNGLISSDDIRYTISDISMDITPEEIEQIAAKAGVDSMQVENWNWYKWDANCLESQGLDKKMLGSQEAFFVNYEHAEILYSQGMSYEGTKYYSMTGLNAILEEK